MSGFYRSKKGGLSRSASNRVEAILTLKGADRTG